LRWKNTQKTHNKQVKNQFLIRGVSKFAFFAMEKHAKHNKQVKNQFLIRGVSKFAFFAMEKHAKNIPKNRSKISGVSKVRFRPQFWPSVLFQQSWRNKTCSPNNQPSLQIADGLHGQDRLKS
jgi:hypothetical protein